MTDPTQPPAAAEPKVEMEWAETFNDGSSDTVQILSYSNLQGVYGTRWRSGHSDVSDTYLAEKILSLAAHAQQQAEEIERLRAGIGTWKNYGTAQYEVSSQKSERIAELERALARAESTLRHAASIFNNPNFTDRYGDGELFSSSAAAARAALKEKK